MSSPPPPGPPPGPPPTGSPPPSGVPPPPPPTNTSGGTSITSANYFFGFVVTFVVLLLLFVGCGIGSWRRFRLIGTAWDERLQDMDGGVAGRKRGRRRLVRPVLAEAWTHPAVASKDKWDVQPIAAAFVWSRATLSAYARKAKAAAMQGSDGPVRTVGEALRAYVLPRRARCDSRPPRPSPVARPPPEAIQVAVMIAMPTPPVLKPTPSDGERCVGHAEVGEYQIGVVRIPWPSGQGL